MYFREHLYLFSRKLASCWLQPRFHQQPQRAAALCRQPTAGQWDAAFQTDPHNILRPSITNKSNKKCAIRLDTILVVYWIHLYTYSVDIDPIKILESKENQNLQMPQECLAMPQPKKSSNYQALCSSDLGNRQLAYENNQVSKKKTLEPLV